MTDPKELAQPYEVVEGYGQKYIVDPNGNKEWIVNSGGFTKEEVVMKDFMAAIISSQFPNMNMFTPEAFAEKVAGHASMMSKAYFKELNKKDK